jgi:cell division protein FtsB
MKFPKSYLIIAALVVVAIILLSGKLIVWGLAMLGAALIILGIQQLIQLNVKVTIFEDNIKKLDEKNNDLAKQNKDLAEENNFLRERHFQVTQIKSILELNLFEIDTKFSRPVTSKEEYDGRDIKYFGSLSVSLKAKYGIDIKELRFKYDSVSDVLTVANINPKFLSFGTRKMEWDFFEIFEYRSQNIFADPKWMVSFDLYEYAARLKEKYRVKLENSIDKGPEEFEWIHKPIRENVENAIKVLFRNMCPNIEITDKADDSFIPLEKLSFGPEPVKKKLSEHT